MSWAEGMMRRGRDLVFLTERLDKLEGAIERLTDASENHEHRLIRIETTIQLLGGITLPPISSPSPRLPRR